MQHSKILGKIKKISENTGAVGVLPCIYTVNCRIGSLENIQMDGKEFDLVNCRIGSLESPYRPSFSQASVNCRIGSLEMHVPLSEVLLPVNCRIGSLEKVLRG